MGGWSLPLSMSIFTTFPVLVQCIHQGRWRLESPCLSTVSLLISKYSVQSTTLPLAEGYITVFYGLTLIYTLEYLRLAGPCLAAVSIQDGCFLFAR